MTDMGLSSGRARPAAFACVISLLAALLLIAPQSRGEARATSDGIVSGRVLSASGVPVAGAKVRVYERGHTSADNPWDYVRRILTDADGRWSIQFSGTSMSGSYLISADARDEVHIPTWYQRSPTPEAATPVPFVAGTHRPGVNIALLGVPKPGRVSGVLRGNGARLSAVRVAAFAAHQSDNEWPVRETRSTATGAYTLDGLAPGAYRIMADGTDYGLPVRFWRNATTWQTATLVTVTDGGTLPGVDFNLTVSQVFPPKPAGRIAVPRAPAGLRALPLDKLAGYQGQAKCRRSARKGTKALLRLLRATYGTSEGAGLNRACTRGTSEHYDGRAIDWMVHSRIPAQARKGDAFTRWLTRAKGRDVGVMSRRLGVMYVIWRGRIWKQYQASAGWQTYSTCHRRKYFRTTYDSFCHRNHVHISLTHAGAGMRTSWWRALRAS